MIDCLEFAQRLRVLASRVENCDPTNADGVRNELAWEIEDVGRDFWFVVEEPHKHKCDAPRHPDECYDWEFHMCECGAKQKLGGEWLESAQSAPSAGIP